MEFADVGAGRGVDEGFEGFFETGVAPRGGGRGGRRGRGVEEARASEEEFAVEFEDLVEFGGDVGADDVLDADAGGFDFALLFCVGGHF